MGSIVSSAEAREDRLSSSSQESDPQAASDVPTIDGGEAHGSTSEGLVPSDAVVVATLDAGLARERTRQALFGQTEVEHKINRYTVIDQLGAGAMGVVYSAYDPDLDRRIAVKLVRPSRRDSGPESRERMIAEARAMAKVSHPNVVSVFEVGVTDTEPPSVFVAMEYVQGRTLRKWVDDDEPTWRQIVRAYAAAGRGLAAVHRAGLVHRDFKPENAMIDAEGRVRVMDFGLARDTDDAGPPFTSGNGVAIRTEELTRTGELVGTPAYMAPERFSGEPAHPGSDQWAFCISLYEALWGTRPYVANSVGRLAMLVVAAKRPPDPPSSDVPRRVRAAILRGLHPDPHERWPSMDALVSAIASRRSSAWTMAWLGLGGVALASAWLLQKADAEQQPCVGAAEALGDAWGPARAEAVRNAFEQASAGFGARTAATVASSLDAWCDAWIAQHREACEATHVLRTQSDAMLDRRMRCLERRRRELSALADALGQADAAAVELAEDAVDALVPPARCADTAFLDATTEPPSDPEVARAVDDLRAELASIDAARELGRPEVALERAQALRDRVTATDYAPLQAEVAFSIGRLLFETTDREASIRELELAYFTARRVLDPVTAGPAALEIASIEITFGTDYARGEEWLRLAEVEAEAHGLEALSVDVANMWIRLYDRRGEADEAIARAEALLERLTPDCGEACSLLPELHSNAAYLYANMGRSEEALAHARRALALVEERYGDDHPQVAHALLRLGNVLDGAYRPEEALRAVTRGLEIRERAYGPDHLNTAIMRTTRGVALASLDRADEGAAEIERALATMRKVADQQLLAATLNQLGWVYSQVDRTADAIKTYEEAVTIMRALHPDGHPTLAVLISNLALEFDTSGDRERALAAYEEAFAMRRSLVHGRDPQLAQFTLNLGRILRDMGRLEEARARFRETLDILQDEPLSFLEIDTRRSLVDALETSDPPAAEAVRAEGRARCAAAEAEARKAAKCELLTAAAESRGSPR
jgi:tetratricopeptide (TPR) repeat protein/predicted Ser/Thr protein kinase